MQWNYHNISNSLLTKSHIKSRRPRHHNCVTQEHTKFGTFGSITKKRFDSDLFYQKNFKDEYWSYFISYFEIPKL